jgi:selenocysteine lyase/cysteine desulfurase
LITPFKSYSSFRAFNAGFLTLAFGIPASLLYFRHGLGPIARSYAQAYWRSGWEAGLLLAFALPAMWIVFWSDLLEHFYYAKFRRHRRRRSPNLDRFTQALALFSMLLVLYVVPFLHLYSPGWMQFVMTAGPYVFSVLGYFSFFSSDIVRESVPSLTSYHFPKSHFDVPTLAPSNNHLRDEIAECQEHLRTGPGSRVTLMFLSGGGAKTAWRGLEGFFHNMSRLLSNVAPQRITLHDRTTAALSFALAESLDHVKSTAPHRPPVLATTDCEFPDVRRAVIANFEQSHGLVVHEAPISDLIWDAEPRTRLTEKLFTFLADRQPDIVLLSHVLYWSGTVLDLAEITRRLRELERPPVLIIDGAQALGNVNVGAELFDAADYYACCAHKWLLVPHTLGILVRHEKNLAERHGLRQFRQHPRPYSSYVSGKQTLGCTINLESYFGLNAMLQDELLSTGINRIAEHNQKLCEMFLESVLPVAARVPGAPPRCSFASLSFGNQSEAVFRTLERRNITCNLLKSHYNGAVQKLIRFGFHYFHSENDALKLAAALEEEWSELRAQTSLSSFAAAR